MSIDYVVPNTIIAVEQSSTHSDKRKRSKEVYEALKRKNDEQEARYREKLQVVKQEATRSGKEPFDIEKFSSLYDWGDGTYKAPITAQLVERFESQYYLNHPEVQTLAELAHVLFESEQHSAG